MDLYIGTILMWPIKYATTGTVSCYGQLLPMQQNQALFALLGVTYGGDGRTTVGVPNLINRVPYGSTDLGGGVTNGGPVTPAGSHGPYGATAAITGTAVGTLGLANLPGHTHPATFTPTSGNIPVSVSAPASTLAVTIPVAASAPSSAIPTSLSGTVYLANTAGPPASKGPFQSSVGSGATLGANVTGNPGGTFTGNITAMTGGGVTVTSNNSNPPAAFTAALTPQASTGQLPRPPFLAINFIIATVGIWPDNPN